MLTNEHKCIIIFLSKDKFLFRGEKMTAYAYWNSQQERIKEQINELKAEREKCENYDPERFSKVYKQKITELKKKEKTMHIIFRIYIILLIIAVVVVLSNWEFFLQRGPFIASTIFFAILAIIMNIYYLSPDDPYDHRKSKISDYLHFVIFLIPIVNVVASFFLAAWGSDRDNSSYSHAIKLYTDLVASTHTQEKDYWEREKELNVQIKVLEQKWKEVYKSKMQHITWRHVKKGDIVVHREYGEGVVEEATIDIKSSELYQIIRFSNNHTIKIITTGLKPCEYTSGKFLVDEDGNIVVKR